MSDPRLRFVDPEGVSDPGQSVPLGRQLVDLGLITQTELLNALGLQRRVDAQLGDILVAEGAVHPDDLLAALARQHNAQLVDLDAAPPRRKIARALPSSLCLQHQVVPWIWLGKTLLVATARPDLFDHLRQCMGPYGPMMLPVIASPGAIRRHINRLYSADLAHKAITRVASVESCRNWGTRSNALWLWSAGFALTTCMILSPAWTVTVACLWAVLTLMMTTLMKAAAFGAQIVGALQDHLSCRCRPVSGCRACRSWCPCCTKRKSPMR